MRVFIPILILAVFSRVATAQTGQYTIVIHGGAGNISPIGLTDSTVYKETLDSALQIGVSILKSGGSSIDAVEKVICFLENCPLYNAGKGAVFTAEGRNELDASIMDGNSGKAGAIAGVGDIKNPIKAARLVMDKSPHVMLSGKGASIFAKENGLEIVDSSYFKTEQSWNRYLQSKKPEKHGTVGCVALDQKGNLAAGTSTGGMMNKKYGRIGDSPIIGAGTYANNITCAISCTGHGEFFIRNSVAFQIHALMLYRNMDLKSASKYVIHDIIGKQGGTGGIIGVDKDGNYTFEFNTAGMFRAAASSSGKTEIKLFK